MEISSNCVDPSAALQVVLFFSIVWPVLAMASVSRHGRSSAPIDAALVALSVILCAAWLEQSNVVGARAMSGAGHELAGTAVRATWVTASTVATWPIAWIAVLSLLLHHRPTVDRTVLAFGAVLCVSVVAASHFETFLAWRTRAIRFAREASALMLVIALTAAMRLFVVTRASKNVERSDRSGPVTR